MASRALARDKLGVPAVLFFMLAGIAPRCQQASRSDLTRTAQSDSSRLTSQTR